MPIYANCFDFIAFQGHFCIEKALFLTDKPLNICLHFIALLVI